MPDTAGYWQKEPDPAYHVPGKCRTAGYLNEAFLKLSSRNLGRTGLLPGSFLAVCVCVADVQESRSSFEERFHSIGQIPSLLMTSYAFTIVCFGRKSSTVKMEAFS